MKNMKVEGNAIAFVRTLGDNSVLGLLTHHYLSKMKTNQGDAEYQVCMPRMVTVFTTSDCSNQESRRLERAEIANTFKTEFTVRSYDYEQSTGEFPNEAGLIFHA